MKTLRSGFCFLAVLLCLHATAAVRYVNVNNAAPSAPYTSWANAAKTIQDAVNTATDGDVIWVTNGVYQVGGAFDEFYGNLSSNRVLIDKQITVQSVNGPAVTTILGQPFADTNGVRCVEMVDGATLSGFTLKNGGTLDYTGWYWGINNYRQQSGGGVWCEGPNDLVTNCLITGCVAYVNGGGAAGNNGVLKNCTLTNNSAGSYGGGANQLSLINCSLLNNTCSAAGGGAQGSALTNCVLSGNSAQWDGGGAVNSTLVNCAVAKNFCVGSGGGIANGSVVNCTITANTAMNSGGGAIWSTLNNSILFQNNAPGGANFIESTLNFCDTTPLPDNGTNNITADPQLQDSAHLKSTSPCIGAGNFSYIIGVDIDGDAWVNPPSIGCDEFFFGPATGALLVSIKSGYTNVAANFPAGLTGVVLGHASNIIWNFGDGSFSTNQIYVAHRWNTPGNYSVTLTAFNDANPAGVIATFPIQVVTQPVFYVRANNASPSAPFNSWATAATNIQDAVAAVTVRGSLVLVTNGVYQSGGRYAYGSLSNRIAALIPMDIRSVSGPATTVISGNPTINGNAIRCAYLADGAMLTGFTLTNGGTWNGGAISLEQSGGGIRCESANTIVSNCVVTGNFAYNYGAGIEGGMILNSTITGNTSVSGAGAHGAELRNCFLSLNAASGTGGAVKSCTVRNSALTANATHASGGAADGSALFNCTVTGNRAGVSGGGVNNSALVNSIVYFNTAAAGANYSGSVLDYCCTTPLPSGGASNITAVPQLADNAHIGVGSPCIGAGNFSGASGVDFDGEAWANPPSIGSDEFYSGAVMSALSVSALANYTNVAVGFPANFSALISGHATNSVWNFGDGNFATNQIYTTHSWSLPGDYIVTLTAFNGANPVGVSATIPVHVTSQTIFYVAVTNANPVAPFNSWATAATNIQDAADVACAGGTVLVNDGIYQNGGSVAFGFMTNRVNCARPMNLRSVNGKAATVIAGNPFADDTAVRGASLVNGCVMSGFTVTNGATRTSGDVNLEQSGGGVWCESAGVVVSNCVFIANYAQQGGGGAYQGTFTDCVFNNDNTAGQGGGAFLAALNDCVLSTNTGNGAVQCTLNHCTLIANSGSGAVSCIVSNCFFDGNGGGEGAGVSYCTVFNSTINNCFTGGSGGGAAWSTLFSCILSNNSAGVNGGGAHYCTLSNCTLVANYAPYLGGGANVSTLDRCTVINNKVDQGDGGGAYDCIMSRCTLTGNHASAYGGGACVSTLKNCVLSGNSAAEGGAFSGYSASSTGRGNSLSNCAVFGNSANNGGGVERCVAVNCTITGNNAVNSGGGAKTATLNNCIVYHNGALTKSEYDVSTLNYCDTFPLPSGGMGNITNEPALADFAHISASSPCIGAGSFSVISGSDIDGEAWLNPPSIGCDEFYSGAATGALLVAITANFTNCANGFTVNFIGQISGHATRCVWNFGDGSSATNQLYPTHSWSSGGNYTVTLTAFNDSNPGGVSASIVIHVLSNPIYYVSLASTNPVSPFNSWATAATNIQDAVDVAFAGGTVLVTNGIYNAGSRALPNSETNRVAVQRPMFVNSVNGAAATAIEGFPSMDGNGIRCVYLTNDASLTGFTLTNGGSGGSGGGVLCESIRATMSDCLVISNVAPWAGGGASGGTLNCCTFIANYAYFGGGANGAVLRDCTLSNNAAYYGGGASGCTLTNSLLVRNHTYVDSDYTANGGGAESSTLTGCLLKENSSNHGGGASSCTLFNCVLSGNISDGVYFAGGGGASGSTLVNCTLVGNRCLNGGGGGVMSSSLTNCIVYFNIAPDHPNFSEDNVFVNCDATPLPTNGVNNISSDPLFVDPLHISSTSPCRGAGIFSATSGTDIDGDAWVNPPSIGADEFNAASATGSLAVAISATFTNVTPGFVVDFNSQISGHATANRWDFGDGTMVSNRLSLSHSWAVAGNYTVTFTVFNTDNPGGVSASVVMSVLNNPVHYVAIENPTPVAPYLSWVTAATNIQDAVDAAYAGGMVIVSNGVYQTGSRLLYGTMTNRVAVTKPLTLQSVNGATVTVIDGGGLMRCVYLTNRVSLKGFTLQNGVANNGAGVFCEDYNDILNDCVLMSNSCPFDWTSGGGTYRGILNRCTLTGNSASYLGGAAVYAGLNFCTLTNNGPAAYGGAGLQCSLNNCKIINNTAAWGGGVANCEADNCLLVGNYAYYGGGASYYGPLNNCTIVSNTVATGPGTYGGGGVLNGSAFNCIIYYNNGGNCASDWSGIQLNHSCTTPDIGGIEIITNAPLLVDMAGGDFRLNTNSPCINAGNNALSVGTNDLDGLSRTVGGTVDIGAYEFQSPTSLISYAYLQRYGFPMDGSVDYLDSDNDGFNNWQEWRTGTSPLDASSRLRMFAPLNTNNASGVTISWQSVYGINYLVQRSGNLSAPFSTIETNILGQSGTTTYTDAAATNSGPYFYRVGVQ